MDSVMLGSLTLYRRLLLERGFFERRTILALDASNTVDRRLSTVGHATAGLAAGWTVSFVAAPVEHIKARLQIQYAADKSARFYSGPIDCTRRIVCLCVWLSFLLDLFSFMTIAGSAVVFADVAVVVAAISIPPLFFKLPFSFSFHVSTLLPLHLRHLPVLLYLYSFFSDS